MTNRDALVAACDRELVPERFKDYTVNGLQVEGRDRVVRVMSGVTACQALVDEAVAWQADLVLVHHGYFWKNEPVAITGMKRRRLRALLAHDISLLAYHLPLDAHADLGNNAELGRRLDFAVDGCADGELGEGLVWLGSPPEGLDARGLAQHVGQRLAREPQLVEAPGGGVVHRGRPGHDHGGQGGGGRCLHLGGDLRAYHPPGPGTGHPLPGGGSPRHRALRCPGAGGVAGRPVRHRAPLRGHRQPRLSRP